MPRFGNDQSAAARALNVSQSTLSRLLNEPSHGGSMEMARKVASYLNISETKILVGEAEKAVRQLRELPGFEEAFADAALRVEHEHPGITREDLEMAADTRATPEPKRVTAGLLIHIAIARRNPPESRTLNKRPRRHV